MVALMSKVRFGVFPRSGVGHDRAKHLGVEKRNAAPARRPQSFGHRLCVTMQRAAATMWASSYRAFAAAIVVCWIAPGARSAPTTSVPMAELFTLEEPLSSSAPFEFPDEYSISIEQAMINRNDFAKAAVLRMILAMAEDIAHERQVSAALLEAVDDVQKRLRRHEDKARALEQHMAAVRSGTPRKLRQHEPTSCRDLRLAGHVLSGFYLVRVADRMETVFCSLSDDQVAGVSHENQTQAA